MANLAYGSSGSDVRALQEALKKAGYNIAADGVFGKETQNAVRQYQSAQGLGVDGVAGQRTFDSLGLSGGNSGGGTNSGGGYNNSGLTTDQIVEMQNYYGTKADGLWGANSTASAGGLNAQQAWQQYQQQKQQQMQETMMPEMIGFDAFYNRMGGADFEKKLRESINASVQQAVNAYEAQKQETEQDASEMARQAYVAKLLGEKNMAQQLAAGGYAGGMAESAMLESETNYQNNLAEIQRQRQRALDEIQRAIDNARLTGDMEIANQLADYMAQVQSYYSDYFDTALAQMQQAQAAAQKAATSAVTPSVTPSGVVASTTVINPGGGTTEQAPSFSNVKRSIAGALQTGNPTQAATLVTQVWGSASEAQKQELRNLMSAAGYNIAG